MEIERDFFEHLLRCLVDQKTLHSRRLPERVTRQMVIDEAWQKGVALLQEVDGAGPPGPPGTAQ